MSEGPFLIEKQGAYLWKKYTPMMLRIMLHFWFSNGQMQYIDITSVTYNQDQRPGVSNLISIHSFLTNKSIEEICSEAQHLNTGQYKLVVAEVVVEYLKPIQANIARYLASPEYLIDVLQRGNAKAHEIASNTWEEVQYKLGIKYSLHSKDLIQMKK